MCESVGNADLLSDRFDSKQFREAVDLPLTCHPSPSLTTFAFRSIVLRPLLLDLDPYGGTDPLGMFLLFLKICLRCLCAWYLFVFDDSWHAVVSLQPPSLFIGKVWVPVMQFCVCMGLMHFY